jgi:hypothetical protein
MSFGIYLAGYTILMDLGRRDLFNRHGYRAWRYGNPAEGSAFQDLRALQMSNFRLGRKPMAD